MRQIVDNAIENGYAVAWAADVSEGGFKWKEGYAIIPAEVDEANTTDSEISRWVQLDDNARDKKRFEKKGPQKEIEVTQEMRRKHFDNWETTDDHGMVIEGIATDQEGNRYYKVKNSWDTNRDLQGIFLRVGALLPRQDHLRHAPQGRGAQGHRQEVQEISGMSRRVPCRASAGDRHTLPVRRSTGIALSTRRA